MMCDDENPAHPRRRLLALTLILAECPRGGPEKNATKAAAEVTFESGTRLISREVTGMTCVGCEIGIWSFLNNEAHGEHEDYKTKIC